jgi:hypothetical protein
MPKFPAGINLAPTISSLTTLSIPKSLVRFSILTYLEEELSFFNGSEPEKDSICIKTLI